MNWGKALAIGNIIFQLGASAGYLYGKDWRHGIYWASASVLTASMTF